MSDSLSVYLLSVEQVNGLGQSQHVWNVLEGARFCEKIQIRSLDAVNDLLVVLAEKNANVRTIESELVSCGWNEGLPIYACLSRHKAQELRQRLAKKGCNSKTFASGVHRAFGATNDYSPQDVNKVIQLFNKLGTLCESDDEWVVVVGYRADLIDGIETGID